MGPTEIAASSRTAPAVADGPEKTDQRRSRDVADPAAVLQPAAHPLPNDLENISIKISSL